MPKIRKALVIAVDGKVSFEEIKDLKDMQRIVGGYVEGIPFTGSTRAYLNEDGKGLKLPKNEFATKLCSQYEVGLNPFDYIAGPMFILGDIDEDGYNTDVPDQLAEDIVRRSTGVL